MAETALVQNPQRSLSSTDSCQQSSLDNIAGALPVLQLNDRDDDVLGKCPH